jgi:hypothetical protein
MTSAAPAPDAFADTQPGTSVETDGLDLDLDLTYTPASQAPLVAAPAATPAAAFLVSATPAADRRVYDATQPTGTLGTGWLVWRVLVASTDETERMYLRARLALANLAKVDEALSTTQALSALSLREYTLVFVNDDSVTIDASAVAAAYRARNRLGSLVVSTASLEQRNPLNLLARWREHKLRQHLGDARFTRVLGKPLNPSDVADVLQNWARIHAS